MKKVLMCVPNYYTSVYQVGSHHYARAFEKLGYKVAFISDPISPLHSIFANSETLRERSDIHATLGSNSGNIYYYVPKAFLTPQNRLLLKSWWLFEYWYKMSQPNLLEVLKRNGFGTVDILWIESPFYHFMLQKITHTKSILRLADYSKGFNDSWGMYYDKEISIANQADLVICSAQNILSQYSKIADREKILYMPNGIDLDQVEKSDKSLPVEFYDILSPRIIYVGMIDYWFDIDLVCRCAKIYPKYNFIFIGNSNIDLSKFKSFKNIFYLGSMPHSSISKYLANSDVGIIPFKKCGFVDSINPIKLYEYAAHGLKIVSMCWKETESLKDMFDICDTQEHFIDSLQNIENRDLDQTKKWLVHQDWILKIKKIVEQTK